VRISSTELAVISGTFSLKMGAPWWSTHYTAIALLGRKDARPS
jgi:hypothetical protein